MGGAAGGGAETGLGAEPLARVVGAAAGAAGTAAVRGFATGEDSAALGSNTPVQMIDFDELTKSLEGLAAALRRPQFLGAVAQEGMPAQ